jgi:SAM-dependent methyltransferase
MSDTPRSVAFDRGVETYDATRILSPEAWAEVRELLVGELHGRGPVLEVGVGTGRIALPLHEAGLDLVGMDLSVPMLRKLAEKSGGRPPVPLAQADATMLPFTTGAIGGAYAIHVLHLIPGWRDVLDELARVVRSGGVVLIDLGGLSPEHDELNDRVRAELGGRGQHPGLDGEDAARRLDAAFAELGAGVRELGPVIERWAVPPGDFLKLFEGGVFSWSWPIPEEERKRAADAVRPWVAERFGSLEEPHDFERRIVWRAYDLP